MIPERDFMTLNVKSNVELNDKSEVKKLQNDVILRLSESIEFEIIPKEEMQTIWYLIPDTMRLEEYISVDQSLELTVVETTENHVKFQNLFLVHLASKLSNITNEKVVYEPFSSSKKYDLIIPKFNDVQKIGNYLNDQYGIELVKKQERIKVKIASFN